MARESDISDTHFAYRDFPHQRNHPKGGHSSDSHSAIASGTASSHGAQHPRIRSVTSIHYGDDGATCPESNERIAHTSPHSRTGVGNRGTRGGA